MDNKYRNEAVLRATSIVQAMAGHEANGLTTGEIAKRVKTSTPNATKSLANLREAGWVEPHPRDDRRWRLAPVFVQLSNTVTMNLSQALRQLNVDQANYNKVM